MTALRSAIAAAAVVSAAALAAPAASAQLTARRAFLSAPMSVLPTLTQSHRMDMLDYFDAGMPERTEPNVFGGENRILSLSDSMIVLMEGEGATLAMATLPAGADTLIAVIETLETPVADSSLRFFTSGWAERTLLEEPGLEQWATGKPDRVMKEDVPFTLSSATFDPATATLTLTNRTADMLPRDLADKYRQRMAAELRYRWDGSRFRKMK